MFKVNNKNNKAQCKTCLKSIVEKSEQHHWHLTYFTPSSSVFIVDFKQVNANWDNINLPSSNWEIFLEKKKLVLDFKNITSDNLQFY